MLLGFSKLSNVIVLMSISLLLPSRSTAQWVKTKGLSGVQIRCLVSNGTNLYAGTKDSGIYLFKNNEDTWLPVNSGLENTNIHSIAFDRLNIFAASDKGISRSTDNGGSWSTVDSTLRSNLADWGREGGGTRLFFNGSKLFAGTVNYGISSGGGTYYGYIYVSDNYGSSWTRVPPWFWAQYASFAAIGNKVIACFSSIGNHNGFSNNFYQSTDVDTTWLHISSISVPIITLSILDNIIFSGSASMGIFVSKNNGLNWTPSDSGLFDTSSVYSFSICNGDVFAGTSQGVFLSKNKGAYWTSVNFGLPQNPTTRSLTVSGTNLFATIDSNGIWRRSLSEMVGVIKLNAQIEPQNFDFFNLKTPYRSHHNAVISFSLGHTEQVSVKLYDLSGHEVATIINKQFDFGSHSLTWNTENIVTGFYTVRMQAGRNSYAKSILISR